VAHRRKSVNFINRSAFSAFFKSYYVTMHDIATFVKSPIDQFYMPFATCNTSKMPLSLPIGLHRDNTTHFHALPSWFFLVLACEAHARKAIRLPVTLMSRTHGLTDSRIVYSPCSMCQSRISQFVVKPRSPKRRFTIA